MASFKAVFLLSLLVTLGIDVSDAKRLNRKKAIKARQMATASTEKHTIKEAAALLEGKADNKAENNMVSAKETNTMDPRTKRGIKDTTAMGDSARAQRAKQRAQTAAGAKAEQIAAKRAQVDVEAAAAEVEKEKEDEEMQDLGELSNNADAIGDEAAAAPAMPQVEAVVKAPQWEDPELPLDAKVTKRTKKREQQLENRMAAIEEEQQAMQDLDGNAATDKLDRAMEDLRNAWTSHVEFYELVIDIIATKETDSPVEAATKEEGITLPKPDFRDEWAKAKPMEKEKFDQAIAPVEGIKEAMRNTQQAFDAAQSAFYAAQPEKALAAPDAEAAIQAAMLEELKRSAIHGTAYNSPEGLAEEAAAALNAFEAAPFNAFERPFKAQEEIKSAETALTRLKEDDFQFIFTMLELDTETAPAQRAAKMVDDVSTSLSSAKGALEVALSAWGYYVEQMQAVAHPTLAKILAAKRAFRLAKEDEDRSRIQKSLIDPSRRSIDGMVRLENTAAYEGKFSDMQRENSADVEMKKHEIDAAYHADIADIYLASLPGGKANADIADILEQRNLKKAYSVEAVEAAFHAKDKEIAAEEKEWQTLWANNHWGTNPR